MVEPGTGRRAEAPASQPRRKRSHESHTCFSINRDDKRPVLADLRESGSIEQDADQVMFVYREAYYLETKAPSDTIGIRVIMVVG